MTPERRKGVRSRRAGRTAWFGRAPGVGLGVLVALGMAILATACGGEGRADAPHTVRDSAGIPVVENRAPTWAPGEAWLVDAEPVLTLGSLDGPEETQFFDVATVRLRDDGALLVADAGNHRISAFDSDGIYLWSQGREGEGPEEYQGISTLLMLPGDSALVYDGRARRVTVLAPDGTPARSYTPVPPEGSSRNAPMTLAAEGLTVSSAGVVFTSEDGGTAGRLERRPERFLLTDTEGTVADTLGSLPGREMWLVANEQMIAVRSVPFAKEAVVDGAGGRVVMAVTEYPEWRMLDTGGVPTRIVRMDAAPPEVTQQDWERARDASIPADAEPETRTRIRLDFEEISRPDRWPAFADVLLDDQRHLWVQRFVPPWEEAAPRPWWVFDPEGILLGEVTFPAGLEVDQIRGAHLVGRWEDELGVQQVRVYRIVGREG